MKRQFMHKSSRDGVTSQPKGALTQPEETQKPTPTNHAGTAATKPTGSSSRTIQSGLLGRWKAGHLNHPDQPPPLQTGSLLEEPVADPLRKRKMPGLTSKTAATSRQSTPVINPFSISPTEVPTVHQPAMPNIPSSTQLGSGQYPSQAQNRPGSASGISHQNPASQSGFPGIRQAPQSLPTPNAPQVSGQLGNPMYGNGQSSGQWDRPSVRNSLPGLVAPQQITTTKKTKRQIHLWARVAIGILVTLIVTTGGAFTYYQMNYASSINDITSQSAIHADGTSSNKLKTAPVDPLKSRTNIVLLGSDTDGKGNDPTTGTPLAQTVIVITIDPKTNYVGMLSIPRDMQVTDALYGTAKIDEAFEHAWQGRDAREKARSAAGHTMDVIEANYGIHIDHYAWVGLQGFIKVIDTIGGIDIDASHPIMDDAYPNDTGTGKETFGYKRLDIAPGPQHFDGLGALEYVRTRHADLGGDFGRTDRQQQVLGQVKVKLQGTDTVTNAPEILKDLDGFLMTDLSIPELGTFTQVANGIDINHVDRVAFTNQYSSKSPTSSNLFPNCYNIVPKIRQMFGVEPNCLPQAAMPVNIGTNVTKTQSPTKTSARVTVTAIRQATPRPQRRRLRPKSILPSIRGTSRYQNVVNLLLLTVSESFNALK